MTHPLVSVGLPLYNEAQHLARTLDSILAQTYQNVEFVISDNCSTDDTGEIARAYAARDPRVRYYRQPENIGASLNFNLVFGLARGEFFHWAAGHDPHLPEFIEQCVEVLKQSRSIALCYPPVQQNGRDIAGNVDTRGESDPFARLGRVLWGTSGGAVYGVFRAELLRKTLLFERSIAPDVILLSELAVLGEFARLEEPKFTLKQGPEYGDWASYVQKIFGEVPNISSLYWSALRRLCVRTGRHFRLRGKVLAYQMAAQAFWYRFRDMREGLRCLDAPLLPEPHVSPGAHRFKRAA